MEYISAELKNVLDCIAQPAFLVRKGQICYANPLAQKLPVVIGLSVSLLLGKDASRYADFTGEGALSVSVLAGSTRCSALVRRLQRGDLFLLTPSSDDDIGVRLAAFGSAAQTLRQPVASLFATAHNLFPHLEEMDDPKVSQQMATLNQQFYQLLRTIGNLSDAAGLAGNTLVMHFETIDLYHHLREFSSEIALLCRQRGVSFSFECPSGSFFANVDTQQFDRAVLNLISNSLKHTPEGGAIEMRLERGNPQSRLILRDNGEGMRPGVLGAAFEQYTTATGFDPRDGLGLGLPIARWIAVRHGGALVLESRPEGGTTAVLSFRTTHEDLTVRSPNVQSSGFDSVLTELSDVLPLALYGSESIN